VGESVWNFFKDEHSLALINKLLKVGVTIKALTKPKSGKLKGKTFVVTGTLSSMSREEAEAKIRSLGGSASGSVSKQTDYVVVGANPGSKYNKAKKLGVKIVNEKEFLGLVK
jgi:DNA ligase (NAD+)